MPTPMPITPDRIMTDENIATIAAAWCSDPDNTAIYYGDISTWDTSAVTSMKNLFR